MATKLAKKNPFAKDLYTKKYKQKIVKPKKGKGSFKRKKNNSKASHRFFVLFLKTFQYLFQDFL